MNIGVFTSGGDSPGMNACIRAVVKTAHHYQVEVFGIYRGYDGMIDDEIKPLTLEMVHPIIPLGGTILKTARSQRFLTVEGRLRAAQNLAKYNITKIVCIGGDGSYKGAKTFGDENPHLYIIGTPGTIDNDLYGTDVTIGYDTAINTAVQAIDKIRDTAESHNRLFFVEVMGRDAGLIALRAGIGAGADAVLIPETKTDLSALTEKLKISWQHKRGSYIIVVAEGDDAGGAFEVAHKIKQEFNEFDAKVSVLGHIQRGGSPTCMDRVVATRMGVEAVDALMEGKTGFAVGVWHRDMRLVPFQEAVKHNNELNPNLLRLVEILSI